MKLSELKTGDHAEVISVVAEPAIRRRLMDMGLVRGTVLEVLRFAPLGDPVEILCNGLLLTMRLNEAEGVTVIRLAQEAEPVGMGGGRRFRHRFGRGA